MSKKVLIPTDFSIESLNTLRFFLHDHAADTYDIVLLHGRQSSDAINDLLFFSKSRALESLKSNEFEEACTIIRNKYASSIHSLTYDLFSGFTQAAFQNYITARKIDLAVIPRSYRPSYRNTRSFNLLPYIRKSRMETIEVGWEKSELYTNEGNLSALFASQVSIG